MVKWLTVSASSVIFGSRLSYVPHIRPQASLGSKLDGS